MKVSDRGFDEVESYLGLGLDVFVGSEPLIPRALAAGATGACPGWRARCPSSWPASSPTRRRRAASGSRRPARRCPARPRSPGLKRVLARRGVPISGDMRAPLRPLTADEERLVDAAVERLALPVT